MRRKHEEKISSVRSGTVSMALFILSAACFVVFLWLLCAVARIVFGAA